MDKPPRKDPKQPWTIHHVRNYPAMAFEEIRKCQACCSCYQKSVIDTRQPTVEAIKHAAIKVGDTVGRGRDHAQVYQSKEKGFFRGSKQGFETTIGRFVTRKEAAEIAFKAGQISKWEKGDALISEELWSTGPYEWNMEQGYHKQKAEDFEQWFTMEGQGIISHYDGQEEALCRLVWEARQEEIDYLKKQSDLRKECRVEKYKDSWAVIWSKEMPSSPITFKNKDMATECVQRYNADKMIETPITFHLDDCCGCSDFYFSAILQEIIVVCNECGHIRKAMFNNRDCDVSGVTLPI